MSRYFGAHRRAETPTGDYVIEQRRGPYGETWTEVTRKASLRAAYFSASWYSTRGLPARIMLGEKERAHYINGLRVDLTAHKRTPCLKCGLKFAAHADRHCRTCHNRRIGVDASARMAAIRARQTQALCVLCGLHPPMAGTDGSQCAVCVEQRKNNYVARVGPPPERPAQFDRPRKFVDVVVPGEGTIRAEIVWDGTF